MPAGAWGVRNLAEVAKKLIISLKGIQFMDIKKEYERWLANATADADVVAELKCKNRGRILS